MYKKCNVEYFLNPAAVKHSFCVLNTIVWIGLKVTSQIVCVCNNCLTVLLFLILIQVLLSDLPCSYSQISNSFSQQQMPKTVFILHQVAVFFDAILFIEENFLWRIRALWFNLDEGFVCSGKGRWWVVGNDGVVWEVFHRLSIRLCRWF